MCISGSCGSRGFLGFLGSRGPRGSRGFLGFLGSRGPRGSRGLRGSLSSSGSFGSTFFFSFPVQEEVKSQMVRAHIYLRQLYFPLVRDWLFDKFVVLSQEMRCFTKVVYLFLNRMRI